MRELIAQAEATQTPLLDLLRGIPADARMIYNHTPTCSQSIPVGVLADRAATHIAWLEDRVATLNAQAEQPAEPDNAIAIVSSADADSVYATVQWLLNPLPGGSLLFEHPDPRIAALTELLKRFVKREYNSFEPENQSGLYYEAVAVLGGK